MADTLKKVKPGDPLAIPAATFNTFVDAAQDFRNRQHRQERPLPPASAGSGTIRVKNASGADRDRFAVLGIDVPVFTPTDNLEGFKNEPVLAGVVPTTANHLGRFVVLAEPLAAGAIGRAVLTGLTPVKVYIDDVAHRAADVDNSNATRLRSSTSGTASILWAEAGTGERWALVRLGGAGGGAAATLLVVRLTKDGGAAGGSSSTCTYTYTVKTLDNATTLGTLKTPAAARLVNCAYLYAGEGGSSTLGLWETTTATLLAAVGERPDIDNCGT